MPKIQEAELLKLRENDAADKATAKELIVDGAAYKVRSQPSPVATALQCKPSSSACPAHLLARCGHRR